MRRRQIYEFYQQSFEPLAADGLVQLPCVLRVHDEFPSLLFAHAVTPRRATGCSPT